MSDLELFMETEALAKRPGDGPYWLGPEISLVDLTFYPWFEQLAALEQLRGIRLPPGVHRLTQWRDAVAQRNTVRAMARPPQFYLDHYPRHEDQAAA